MEYVVNERYFEKVLEIKKATEGYSDEQLKQYIGANINTDDDIVRGVFSGYLDAMENGARIAKVELDMTYDTLDGVIPATIALAHLQNVQGYDNQENAELTMKTLAAYLTLMAVNNHRAKIQVNKRGYRQG